MVNQKKKSITKEGSNRGMRGGIRHTENKQQNSRTPSFLKKNSFR